MVIDTSALVAILRTESERRRFLEAMEAADSRRISVAIFVETSIVIDARYGAEGLRDLDRLIAGANIEIVPLDREQGQATRDAFSRFGKGRHRCIELRGLLLLRARVYAGRAATLQGQRFHPHGYCCCRCGKR